MSDSICPGCGLRALALEGAADPYGGASPACWAAFGEVLAQDYGEYRYPEVHRFIVDAYMAQHPGYATAAGRRSVAVHLVSLHLALEKDASVEHGRRALSRGIFPDKRDPGALEPIPPLGEVTVASMAAARDLEEHSARARVWAEAVWRAWAPHHARVRGWAAEAAARR